ncbi:hypothetical protein J7E81_06320 [Bacillus sp. ISL-18]|uniref:hypothetical protein n=1 Tax=Bacillus sp. ISL-18 TaxID=2819118 RepID=UPI001BE75B7C|nr:hypothetical protein [Bacillus sp. ISL-18]MBT2654866.1 hypothetical protein [Bacillus sp. ISL-18]
MKNQKSISFLAVLISLLSFAATTYALVSHQGKGPYKYKSIFSENVDIYGRGLYQHDSVSMATQALAQDYVTLFLAIPLLIISLVLTTKGLVKGKLLLTGTLGYFLYTYSSYSFLSMYNSMFLVYIIIMSASFFGFILAMMSFDIPKLPQIFNETLPVTFISGFLFVVSSVFCLMWLGKVVPGVIHGSQPVGLEHYTTLIIQALDLGFVIPVGFIAAILLMKRRPFGYLLAAVITFKDVTLVTALSAMVIRLVAIGVQISLVFICIVLLINIVFLYTMVLILKNVKEVSGTDFFTKG